MWRSSSCRWSCRATFDGSRGRTACSGSRSTAGRSRPSRSSSPRVVQAPHVPELASRLAPGCPRPTAPVPQSGRDPRPEGARRGRREHRFPDREGCRRRTTFGSPGRIAPVGASTALPRPRSLLVAHDDAALLDDGRLAARAAARAPGHADRVEPRKLRRRYGVELRPRAVDARGAVRFEDGSELEVDAVVWATGFRPDYSWIDLPVLDDDGRPPPPRGDRRAGPLLRRPHLAAHARVSAARLGQGRRRVHCRADGAFEREPERT